MRPPLLFVLLSLVCVTFARAAETALPKPAEVMVAMEKVADWQIAAPTPTNDTEDSYHPAKTARYSDRAWVRAVAFVGIMALADVAETPKYQEAMRKMSEKAGWKPAPRIYHADDHTIIQVYADLYRRDRKPGMLAPAIERFDYILKHPVKGSLAFEGDRRNDQWAWCDSLFMAPPAWIRLWALTGKQEYLDFVLTQWWRTSDYLYDKQEHLYFRDSSYFDKREANGTKVFWSRGNGWVIGGLVRVMQVLPKDHPARPKFEQQFKEMMAKLVKLQQPDGFWRASLLDPASYPEKEASGTGFFCYGLAWGINEGYLDRATYLPALEKGWAAMMSCVKPDGKLIHVQPIGADPKRFDPDSTEAYGVGAFLLAGSEVYKLTKAQ